MSDTYPGDRPSGGTGGSVVGSVGGRNLPPLSSGIKIAYGVGAMVEGISAQAIATFLFFYATAVCGLPSSLAGLALAVGLVFDAVVDPLIGSTSDGWQSKRGRRLPFMLVGFPIAAICLFLIFALPAGLSHVALFLWLSLISICLRMSISLFLLPYTAVGAELSDDNAERSSIAAWRWMAQMTGALMSVLLGFGVFFAGKDGLLHRSAYPSFGVVIATLVAVAALIASRAVSATRQRQHPAHRAEGRHKVGFVRELGEILRNRSFRVLFAGALLLFTGVAINATLSIHANTYFWHLVPDQIKLITIAFTLGLLFGAPLCGPMMKVVEKRTVIMIGEIGLGVAFAGPVTLRLIGAFPFTGGALVAIIAATLFVGGALMAAAAVAFNSMMADAADEHEYLFGARREGLYFAGWSFALKTATGLGSLVSGVGLDFIGFANAGHVPGAVAAASPETVHWLGALQGIGSGALLFGAAVAGLYYRLDYQTHRKILIGLEKRRTTAAVPIAIMP